MLNMLIQSITQQIAQPKSDLEKNLKALIENYIAQLDLVTAEELGHYVNLLNQAEARIKVLEQQVALKD